MMPGGGKQSSLRKALGALKDTTTVSLAKVQSGYKVRRVNDSWSYLARGLIIRACDVLIGFCIMQELDINIVKATNHVESPSKEKHIRGKCNFDMEM